MSGNTDVKRPFNKKLWRLQKYKKNMGSLVEGKKMFKSLLPFFLESRSTFTEVIK